MKLQISQLRNQVKLLNEMSSDLTMKNAIHAQILPQGMTKGAHDSSKGAGGRAQTLQERREMVKYYKNYKRGERPDNNPANLHSKPTSDSHDKYGSPTANEFVKEPQGKLELHEGAQEEYNDAQPSIIPAEDGEDHDVSDENSAVNKYHAAGLGQAEMAPGSFAHESEEEDGVQGLPDGQVDLTNLPSAFANATERPRALTIHDTNVQSQGPGKPQQARKNMPPGAATGNASGGSSMTPRTNSYNSNPSQMKPKQPMAKQRAIGAYHSGSYQQLPNTPQAHGGNKKVSDLQQRRDKKKMGELTKQNSGLLMKASQRNVGLGLHTSSSQNTSAGNSNFRGP